MTEIKHNIYLGYDLGDGETIICYILSNSNEFQIKSIDDVEMPSIGTSGIALPTIYGILKDTKKIVFSETIMQCPEEIINIRSNFKRCPHDLIKPYSDEIDHNLQSVFLSNKEDWPKNKEVNNKELLKYKESIIEFTNAIFTDEKFTDRIESICKDRDELVIVVGHPTKWKTLDKLIFKKILSQSVLGKKKFGNCNIRIEIGEESRAAFLYARSIYLKRGLIDCDTLIIDVGSSSTDLTAVSKYNFSNYALNDGLNHLGARLIDYLILEWLEDEIRSKGDWDLYQDQLNLNPNQKTAIILGCRIAKEKMFSNLDLIKVKIPVDIIDRNFRLARINLNEMFLKPIAPVLRKYFDASENLLKQIGNRNFKQEFCMFLSITKKLTKTKGIDINRIILTGSASKMPVIKDSVENVFQNKEIILDMNPAKTIARGLSCIGLVNEKSKNFREEMSNFLLNGLPEIIESKLPDLFEKIANRLSNIICDDIIIPDLFNWKEGYYPTIQDTTNIIKNKCCKEKIENIFKEDETIKDNIADWIENEINKEIEIKINNISHKYGIGKYSINEIEMTDSTNIDGLFDPEFGINITEKMISMDELADVIAGILAIVLVPIILDLILSIIAIISIDLAVVLFILINALPVVGQGILITILGTAAYKIIKQGYEKAKDLLAEKMVSANIPELGRKIITDNRIRKSINSKKYDIKQKIYTSMMEKEVKNKIRIQIKNKLIGKIEKDIEFMRYKIEII